MKFGRILSAVIAFALIWQIGAVRAVAQEIDEIVDSIAAMADDGIIASGYCVAEGDGTNLSWTLTEDGVLTISGKGKMINPDYESVFLPWSDYDEKILSVVVNDGVSNIGDYSFSDCKNLITVKMPNSVTIIGKYAFGFCESISDIEIPNSITNIGYGAFAGCSNLTSIEIPKSVTSIDGDTFRACCSLTSIDIPDSVTSIGDYAFLHCDGIESIFIPKTVTSMGCAVFSGEKLRNIFCEAESKPDGWDENWLEYTWSSTFSKHTVHWGYTGKNIIDSGYCGGEGDGTNLSWTLTEDGTLTISGIGEMQSCAYPSKSPWDKKEHLIISVVIDSGVTSISAAAFVGCQNMISATIPSGVLSIGECAFEECHSLKSITIPDGVKTVDSMTFWNCTSLAEVTVPKSVTNIDEKAFAGCISLKTITVDENNQHYCSINDVLFSKDINELVIYPAKKEGNVYTIPNSVTSIGFGAFSGCKSLTSITIPDSVTSIGKEAFTGCTGLISMIIPSGVTNIEDWAFAGCTRLTSITMPNSITSIADNAFANCVCLGSITIPNSVINIGVEAFQRCSALTSIIIPNSVIKMGYNVFTGCSNLTDIYCEAENEPEGWKGANWWNEWQGGCSATVHWGYKPPLYGDLDGDGEVSITEVNNLLEVIKAIAEISAENIKSVDYNKDNVIDIRDFNYIYNKTLNK